MTYEELYYELSRVTSPAIAYRIVRKIDDRAEKESRVPALMFLLGEIRRNAEVATDEDSLNNLLDQWINEHRRP